MVVGHKETIEDDEALTDEQKAELSDTDTYREVYDISVVLGGVPTDFETTNGGKLTICLPYRRNAGEKDKEFWPVYVDKGGKAEKMTNGLARREGKVFFETTHLSIYAVAYELANEYNVKLPENDSAEENADNNDTIDAVEDNNTIDTGETVDTSGTETVDTDSAEQPGSGSGGGCSTGAAMITTLMAAAFVTTRKNKEGRKD